MELQRIQVLLDKCLYTRTMRSRAALGCPETRLRHYAYLSLSHKAHSKRTFEGAYSHLQDAEQGTLPLHWAVQKLNFEIAEYLLKEKINDPNCRNFEGNTPLHYATVKGSKKMCQLLIEHGAEINAVNDVSGPFCLGDWLMFLFALFECKNNFGQ